MILLTIYTQNSKQMYWGGGGEIDISVKVDRNWKMGCRSCLHKKNHELQMSLLQRNFDLLKNAT